MQIPAEPLTRREGVLKKAGELEELALKFSDPKNQLALVRAEYSLTVPLNTKIGDIVGRHKVGLFISVPDDYPRGSRPTVTFNVECMHRYVDRRVYNATRPPGFQQTLIELIYEIQNVFEQDPLVITSDPSTVSAGPESTITKTSLYESYRDYVDGIEKKNRKLQEQLIHMHNIEHQNRLLNQKLEESYVKVLEEKYQKMFNTMAEINIERIPGSRIQDLTEHLTPKSIFDDTKEYEKGRNLVYFYEEKLTRKRVALKHFPNLTHDSIRAAIEEFKNMLRCCCSDYVVTPFKLAYQDTNLAILMEYGGEALQKYWELKEWQDKLKNIDDIIQTFLKLANGLKAIHDENIYHGDIKPQNILINGDDIRYSDFGAAVQFESVQAFFATRRTYSNIHEYTLSYMAPEAAYPIHNKKELKHVKFDLLDVYSLTLTMFSLITQHYLSDSVVQKNKNVDILNPEKYDKFLGYIERELAKRLPTQGSKKGKEVKKIIMEGLVLLPQDRIKLSEMIRSLEAVMKLK